MKNRDYKRKPSHFTRWPPVGLDLTCVTFLCEDNHRLGRRSFSETLESRRVPDAPLSPRPDPPGNPRPARALVPPPPPPRAQPPEPAQTERWRCRSRRRRRRDVTFRAARTG
nr:apoptotic chromatin condensation inducer in the nucleus-like [Symphalangus syndactylus]